MILLARDRGIERGGADAELLHRLHLIAHQGDQRRDDDADAIAAERRDLKAQRFAGAGRKEHHGIAARHDLIDHLLLLAAKCGIAVDALQDIERVPAVAEQRVRR